MSKGHGIRKIQATLMKLDAQADYDVVKAICKAKGFPIVIPKGDSAWKIEDATAEMIKSLPVDQQIYLRKGLSYYVSLIRSNNK